MNNTALHLASFLGETDYIPHLINVGADPYHANQLGKTPIDVACDEEIRQVFASLGYVSAAPATSVVAPVSTPAKDASRKAAAEENRRQSLVAYKDRKSLSHAVFKRLSFKPAETRPVASSALLAAPGMIPEEPENDKSYIFDMLEHSSVFGRQSFGVKE